MLSVTILLVTIIVLCVNVNSIRLTHSSVLNTSSALRGGTIVNYDYSNLQKTWLEGAAYTWAMGIADEVAKEYGDNHILNCPNDLEGEMERLTGRLTLIGTRWNDFLQKTFPDIPKDSPEHNRIVYLQLATINRFCSKAFQANMARDEAIDISNKLTELLNRYRGDHRPGQVPLKEAYGQDISQRREYLDELKKELTALKEKKAKKMSERDAATDAMEAAEAEWEQAKQDKSLRAIYDEKFKHYQEAFGAAKKMIEEYNELAGSYNVVADSNNQFYKELKETYNAAKEMYGLEVGDPTKESFESKGETSELQKEKNVWIVAGNAVLGLISAYRKINHDVIDTPFHDDALRGAKRLEKEFQYVSRVRMLSMVMLHMEYVRKVSSKPSEAHDWQQYWLKTDELSTLEKEVSPEGTGDWRDNFRKQPASKCLQFFANRGGVCANFAAAFVHLANKIKSSFHAMVVSSDVHAFVRVNIQDDTCTYLDPYHSENTDSPEANLFLTDKDFEKKDKDSRSVGMHSLSESKFSDCMFRASASESEKCEE